MIDRRRLLLAGVASLPGVALTSSAEARKRKPKPKPKPKFRWKSVSNTYTSTQPIPLTNPVAAPADIYPATIRVQGPKNRRIQKVTVSLFGFTHGFPLDLDILLASPDGRGTILMSDAGGQNPNDPPTIPKLTFDDQAQGPVPASLTTDGTYWPTNISELGFPDVFAPPAPQDITSASLATFNGGNPNGAWSLYVVDDYPTDSGSIAGWSLTIAARTRVKVKSKPKKRQTSKGGGHR